MKQGVLLDTSFLIHLVRRDSRAHAVAREYFSYLLDEAWPLYLSSIVSAEFAIRQPVAELDVRGLRPLPFNVPHSLVAARLWSALGASDSPMPIRDDVKLIAQATAEGIPFILTADGLKLPEQCRLLRAHGDTTVRTIVLADGFDTGALRTDGQRSLEFA